MTWASGNESRTRSEWAGLALRECEAQALPEKCVVSWETSDATVFNMNIKAAYSKEKSQTTGALGGGNSTSSVLVSQKGHLEVRQLWPIPLVGVS